MSKFPRADPSVYFPIYPLSNSPKPNVWFLSLNNPISRPYGAFISSTFPLTALVNLWISSKDPSKKAAAGRPASASGRADTRSNGAPIGAAVRVRRRPIGAASNGTPTAASDARDALQRAAAHLPEGACKPRPSESWPSRRGAPVCEKNVLGGRRSAPNRGGIEI